MFDTIAPRYDLDEPPHDVRARPGLAARHRGRAGAPRGRPRPRPGLRDRRPFPARARAGATGWSAPTSAPGMLSANGASTPLVEADGSRLPFADGRLRRARLRLRAAQLHRPGRHTWPSAPGCSAPGGRLAVLEVDAPTARLWRAGYDVWFTKAVPALGRRPLGPRGLPLPAPLGGLPPAGRRPAPDAARAPASPPSASAPWRAASASSSSPPAPAHRDCRGPATPRTVPLEYGPDAPAVRRQPDRALRPPRAHPGRLGHRPAGRCVTRPPTRWPPSPATTRSRRPGSGVVALGALPSTTPWPGSSSSPASPWGSSATPTASPGAGPPRSGRPTRRSPGPTSSSTP